MHHTHTHTHSVVTILIPYQKNFVCIGDYKHPPARDHIPHAHTHRHAAGRFSRESGKFLGKLIPCPFMG